MKQLKVLDLFSGTQSIAREFRKRGHETYTIELDKSHEGIDWYEDILKIEAKDILERFGKPDIIWSSNPCEKFSVAAIGRHWIKGTNLPKTEETKFALKLLEHTVKLIKDLKPTYYFMENPRGKMRKMDCMQELPRYTVTYCQYGDTRMKPTDIWTNHPNPKFKPMCKNGDPCHESAPRGSRTGTQGLKGAKVRSVIPSQLCEHIAKISEEGFLDIINIEDVINKLIHMAEEKDNSLTIHIRDLSQLFEITIHKDFIDELIDRLSGDTRVINIEYDEDCGVINIHTKVGNR